MVRKQSLKNKSRRNNNNKNKNKNRQRGGDGQMGHTGMPLQYFGKALNRYFPEGDANLESPDSAYGKTHAVSHGMDIGKDNMVGPDLAPHHREIEHSGIQTGGRNTRKNRKNKRQNKRNSRKNNRNNRNQNKRQQRQNKKQNNRKN